ncbi:MAG: hypothetical protein AB7G93_01490 [Bdellovibrionales bacterium]
MEFLLPADRRASIVNSEYRLGRRPVRALNPDWTNSWFQMDRGGVSRETIARWERAHNQGFKEELSERLGGLPKLAPPGAVSSVIPLVFDFRTEMQALATFLQSPEGQRRIQAAVPFP